jgi:hypothetical protein
MKEYKFCQSCGFPLKKDKKGGGSEKDGINGFFAWLATRSIPKLERWKR